MLTPSGLQETVRRGTGGWKKGQLVLSRATEAMLEAVTEIHELDQRIDEVEAQLKRLTRHDPDVQCQRHRADGSDRQCGVCKELIAQIARATCFYGRAFDGDYAAAQRTNSFSAVAQ
jgi:hypothetical protein